MGLQPTNYSDTTPAAPAGKINIKWQADAPNANPSVVRNLSAYIDTPSGGSTSFAVFMRRTANITADGANELGTSVACQGENLVQSGSSWSAVEAETSAHGVGSSRSDSSADTYAGWYGQVAFRVGRNLACSLGSFLFRTSDMRLWIGFNSAPGSLPASDAPSSMNYAAFRFSSIGGDTNYQCCTSDGSSQTVVDSGVAADLNHHDFAIQFDDAAPNIKFYIDKNLVATITTHLPTGVLHSMMLCSWHTSSPGAMIGGEYFNIQSDC